MKKLIVLVALMGLASVGYCLQPNAIGNVAVDKIGISPLTLAQINALTADTTHQVVVCSDCDFRLCISTGSHPTTSVGAFVVVGSTTTAAESTAAAVPMHCQ